MWRAAAIGGPFFVRSFLGERDFAKPTTSVTIRGRAAYPHAAAQTRIVSVARIRLDPSTCHAAAPPRNVPPKLDGARGDKSGQTFVPSGIFTSS
jgi:hypothetical protein